MSNKPKQDHSFMTQLATFIVDKRNLFFLLIVVSLIFSAFSRNWVEVENNLTTFLPDDAETKLALDVMENQFTTYGTAEVMVANISYDEAEKLNDTLSEIKGVQSVAFDRTTDHYNHASALYTVTFDYDENNDECLTALDEVKATLADYDLFVSTELGNTLQETIDAEVSVIMVYVAVIVVVVLLLTSQTYGEVPVLLLTFVTAMLLNQGSNFLLGKISFVSNSVTSILQLALSLDYAVILCNHFKEQHETLPIREAAIAALAHSIPEISASSLTTVGGLAAMLFMQFKVGPDMGICLIKAILYALFSVFILMPGLLVLFGPLIEKTRHKDFIPKISFVGKIDYATRHVVPLVFIAVALLGLHFSNKCPYAYGYSSLTTPKLNESQIADNMVADNFTSSNMLALVVPAGDYEKEAKLLEELESYDEIDYTMGLANVEAMDGYMLADALTPRQFSELSGLDYEVAQLVYAAYAAEDEDYSKLMGNIASYKVPLIDMFLFVCDQVDEGYVTLDAEQTDMLMGAKAQMQSAKAQLSGEDYSRMLLYLTLPESGDETYSFIDTIRSIAQEYYPDGNVYVAGNSTNEYDFKKSFSTDNMVVSIVSLLIVLLVLLFTFMSVGMPLMLILVIQGSIWINFSIPYFTGTGLFFMSYLVVSSIQMGANIDYAIVIATRYQELKDKMDHKQAIIETLNFAFPTVLLAAAVMLSFASPAFADGAVHIKTADDLVSLAQSCTLDTWSQGVKVELDADISLDGVDFTPIPSFGGDFDGNGHTISGLNISGKYSRAGLFAEIQEGGSVSNLNVTSTVDIIGSSKAAGGIAGVNAGKISSCTFTGSVSGSVNVGAIAGQNAISGSIRNCTATGAVYGSRMTGGIVGRNLGLISSCGNSVYVNTVNDDKTISIQDISVDTSFDLAKFSNRDTVASTTDTGGIAGYSSGIIRSCHNEAVVGYRHVGYNVGGIAGRSCGFISGCRNSGTVYGRKDVGGIVGQMEPYMELNVENSMLAKMQQQLAELSALIDQTANDAQGGSGAVSSRLSEMGGYVNGALGEIDNIDISIGGDTPNIDIPDTGDIDIGGDIGELPDISVPDYDIVVTPDLSGLAAAISGIGGQLSMLNGEISGAAGAVANDVRAINEKFNELSNTMFDAIFTVGTEDGDILKDTSGVDIDLVKLGKVSANTNTGAVSGDLNIGGIAGAMAIEYEADPEDDVTSNISAEYKREYELKAVLQNCTNKGTVTARRSYVGGVAGRMDLGIITGCRGFGSISSENGDYVGGVAGLASATVRSCWAKCTLSGGKYVGGIVGSGVEEALTGSGSTVTGCVSMVEITDAAQYYGAVSGADAGEYLENYFVSDALPGIDGRSVSGKAEPINYEELTGIDSLPSEFTTLQLSFVADGETLKTVDFDYGDSFDEDVYPEIPAKDGYYAEWDRTDLTDLRFDTVVTAKYELEYTALHSDDTRGDERPVFFVEGKFGDTDTLSSPAEVSENSGLTPLDSELSAAVEDDSTSKLPLLARLTAPISGGIVEQRHVSIPDDGQSTHALHYLPPEVAIGGLNIYVMQDGRWVKADAEEFGSYLRFDVTGTEADIAAVSVISVWWIWGILAAVVLVIVLLVVLSVKRHRNGSPDKTEEKAKAPAHVEKVPKPEKKQRKKPAIIVIIVLLVCALIAVAAVFLPRLAVKLAPYKAIAELERAQELSMNVTADGTLGKTELHTVVPVEIKSDGTSHITRVTIENVPLYYSNGMLILENGKAYGLGGAFPDYSSLLGDIAVLYQSAEYNSDGDTCTVSIGGEQAAELLKALCPALSGDTETVEDAHTETVIENGAVRSITVSATGSIDGAAFEVSAVIDGITRSANFDIPEKVSLAAEKNNASELPEISGDLFRLVSAWAELDGRESIVSSLRLAADCGPVVLDTVLDVSSREYDGKRIYCVGKNDLKLYTDGSSVVNANGTGVTDEETQLAGSAGLLDAVYLACLNGDISAARDGEKYTYTVALDGDSIAQLVEIISPAASKLDADFAYGTASLSVDGGRITGLSVRCTGTMQVVLVETEVSVSADVTIQNGSAPQFPGKAVSALTQANG